MSRKLSPKAGVTHAILATVSLATALAACSGEPSKAQPHGSYSPSFGEDVTNTDTAGGAATAEAEVAFWSLDGELVMKSAVPQSLSTDWTFRYWNIDAALLCERSATLQYASPIAATDAEGPDDDADGSTDAEPPSLFWWNTAWIDRGALESTPDEPGLDDSDTSDEGNAPLDCGIPLPDTLELGLGPPDARLHPAMARADIDPAEVAHSTHFARESGAVYVFGVALPLDEIMDTPGQPPADGRYRFTTLQLLPYPP